MSDTGGRIFISHGSDDREEANALTRYLEERGLSIWIAPRDVRPGVDYSEALQQAIEECAAFIVLVTEKANKSPYVRVETEMAFSLHKPIFPVRTSDVKPGPGLALFLKIRHWTDAYGSQRDESLDRLARELRAAAGGSDSAADARVAAPAAPAPDPAPAAAPAVAPAAAAAQWPSAAAASGETAPADEDLLRAYVGSNADHYLARWRRGSGGWSWTAFLFTAFWAAYRKMWTFAGALAAILIVLMLLGSVSPALNALAGAGIFAVAIWFGLNANRLYRRQAEAALAGLPREDRASALAGARAAGGTSAGAMAGMIALFVVVNLGTAFLLAPSTVPVTAAPVPQPQPQPERQSAQPAPPAQPERGPGPQAGQPPRAQAQGEEVYDPPAQEEPPTEGFYDPPQ